MIVAIDGPAGAGKSTIAKTVARELGFQLVDTGAIYRTVALRSLERGVSIDDGQACAEVALSLSLAFEQRDDTNTLICDGAPVGDEIRTPEVSQAASKVSAHPEVRAALLELQRQIGRARPSVLEGRDIGTVVFPDAEVKIFLTASAAERARRRVGQLAEKGIAADEAAILAEIEERDARDSQRAHAPLKQADDAVPVDTTSLTIEQVIASILGTVRAAQG